MRNLAYEENPVRFLILEGKLSQRSCEEFIICTWFNEAKGGQKLTDESKISEQLSRALETAEFFIPDMDD